MEAVFRPWDAAIATWPPGILALLATVYVLIWQAFGVAALVPLVRRSGLPRDWSFAVAWLIWMPLAGSLALGMTMAGLASPRNFRVVSAVIALSSGISLYGSRRTLVTLWKERRFVPKSRAARAGGALALFFLGLQLFFAAHPERLYDQLNYHLVVSKRLFDLGQLMPPTFDPHLLIAGPVEYAMIWPRVLIDSDFLMVAIGQVWVFLATVIPMLGLFYMLAKQRPGGSLALAAFVFAVPSFIPQNELVGMLKPGAFLLTGTYLAVLSPLTSRRILATLTIPFILLFSACNPTYIHASIALFFASLIAERCSFKRLLEPTPLLAFGLAAFALEITKSYRMTKTFFYPSDAAYLPTPASDAETLAYWHHIGFPRDEHFFQRWYGAIDVPSRNTGLLLWLGLILAIGVQRFWQRPDWSWKGPRLPLVFAALFVLTWPVFYDSGVSSRFVASYTGALLALGTAVMLQTSGRLRYFVLGATVVLGLSVSHADVLMRKVVDWNKTDVIGAFMPQFPRLLASLTVNSFASKNDSVLADDPAKFFFNAAVLHGHLIPSERATWQSLREHPQEAALALRVKAVVIEQGNFETMYDPDRFAGPIREVWDKLVTFGEVTTVGHDFVLHSECYFQARPCSIAQ